MGGLIESLLSTHWRTFRHIVVSPESGLKIVQLEGARKSGGKRTGVLPLAVFPGTRSTPLVILAEHGREAVERQFGLRFASLSSLAVF